MTASSVALSVGINLIHGKNTRYVKIGFENMPSFTEIHGYSLRNSLKFHEPYFCVIAYYYYMCLTAFFQNNMDKPAPER